MSMNTYFGTNLVTTLTSLHYNIESLSDINDDNCSISIFKTHYGRFHACLMFVTSTTNEEKWIGEMLL